ncbi:MAG: DUF2804 domain-containing protein [Solirubrobacteraceae bacterium]
MPLDSLPYRGVFGQPRPSGLAELPLPPAPMPSHHAGRPLKAWRYIGLYGPELMLCLGRVRVGRARQSFWAVWDRVNERMHEETVMGSGGLRMWAGGAALRAGGLRLELRLDEVPGVEAVCPAGASYAWTRKQAPVSARLEIELDGAMRSLEGRAVIDDTAAYYPRHTHWHWSAGIGRSSEGLEVAWNLVSGVNDPQVSSERTVWVAGVPDEVPPCSFSEDLTRIDELRFRPEAIREHRENLLLVRSSYRQPFGTFSGRLPGGIELSEGFGVTEEHDAWW